MHAMAPSPSPSLILPVQLSCQMLLCPRASLCDHNVVTDLSFVGKVPSCHYPWENVMFSEIPEGNSDIFMPTLIYDAMIGAIANALYLMHVKTFTHQDELVNNLLKDLMRQFGRR